MAKKNKVLTNLNENLNIIKTKLHSDKSYDVVIRQFQFKYENSVIDAFLVFFEGMVNKDHINDNILFKANGTFSNKDNTTKLDIGTFFKNIVISNCILSQKKNFSDIVSSICFGEVGIFIDGYPNCFLCNMLKYEHRAMEKPFSESTIKGPQESFNEVLNFNTALIRKNLRDENLIIEKIQIGKRATNTCTIMYIEGLTNKKLVKKLCNRISNIDTDIIISTDTLAEYIDTNPSSPIPQLLPTERPDRAASFLCQGRCVILTNNTPIALIAPTTIVDWFHSPEDAYIKAPYNIILKIIRVISLIAAIFLPALYIATVTYHIDVFPTNIAMTLAASRELVPLTFIVEVLIMEIAFELLREAEMRVPTRIGPVVSIVGGLILGQLAVMANLICSFTMIVVAFSGIALYALPNFYVSYGLRLIRYVFIILAFANGYLALSLGVLIFALISANTYSFGTRMLPSFWIDKDRNFIKQLFTSPVWKNEVRSYTNKAQDKYSQPKVSRRWLYHEEK